MVVTIGPPTEVITAATRRGKVKLPKLTESSEYKNMAINPIEKTLQIVSAWNTNSATRPRPDLLIEPPKKKWLQNQTIKLKKPKLFPQSKYI
jgi:hypothetical protein